MQWSTQVNTAYRTLLDPQARAAYLCELRGVPIDAERNTGMPADFLMQQLQWREELDEARAAADAGAMQALAEMVEQARAQTLSRLAALLDAESADPATGVRQDQATREAATLVRVLMFLDKFRQSLAPLQHQAASQSFISAT
jgi:molecular chaperone HscB